MLSLVSMSLLVLFRVARCGCQAYYWLNSFLTSLFFPYIPSRFSPKRSQDCLAFRSGEMSGALSTKPNRRPSPKMSTYGWAGWAPHVIPQFFCPHLSVCAVSGVSKTLTPSCLPVESGSHGECLCFFLLYLRPKDVNIRSATPLTNKRK